MTKLKQALVHVLTTEGAFTSECAVQINSFDGGRVSLFTDRNNIKHVRGTDYLVVHVVSDQEPVGKRHLLLPTETFETSSRWIDVRESEVFQEAVA